MLGFKRKDPVCGMKEEKGKGVRKDGKWFCSEACLKKYEQASKGMASQEITSCH